MIYNIRTNKRIKNMHVYVIVKRIGRREGFMTKLFMRLFNQQAGREEQQSAVDRLR